MRAIVGLVTLSQGIGLLCSSVLAHAQQAGNLSTSHSIGEINIDFGPRVSTTVLILASSMLGGNESY